MKLSSEDVICLLLASDNIQYKSKKKRTFHLHEIGRFPRDVGEYYTLFPQLTAHREIFYEYFCTEKRHSVIF